MSLSASESSVMEEAPLVAAYAALLALLFAGLSVRTLLLRRRFGVGLGDGGAVELERAVRAHGHFAEYVPFSLLLIYFVESHADSVLMVHFLASTLLIGRGLHAWGVSQVAENYRFRVAGMVCTLVVLVGCSLQLLVGVVTT